MSFYENDGRRVRHHLATLDAVEAARLFHLQQEHAARRDRLERVRPILPTRTATAVTLHLDARSFGAQAKSSCKHHSAFQGDGSSWHRKR